MSIKANNKSNLSEEFRLIVKENPDMKFVLYIRTHPGDTKEEILKTKLTNAFGNSKEMPEQRLMILIVKGSSVQEVINTLNSFETGMYLSYIQSETELLNH